METRLEKGIEQRLVGLLLTRLVLSLVILAIVLGMDALGRSLAPVSREALYWTLGFGFLATAVSGAALRRVQRPSRFGAVQIATDIGLVTALVGLSGGVDSLFTFLYLVVAVYGAVMFQRAGALGAATLCAIAYGAVLLAGSQGWLDPYGGGTESLPILAALWGIHVGALFLVGALASVLTGELHRTGVALDRSTVDLRRLQALHQWTIESIMSGLLTVDPGGRITSFNPEAQRITGLDAGEAMGCDVEAVIPGVRDILGEARGGDSPSTATRARVQYRNHRDEERFLGLAASILREQNGVGVGFVLIFQDVTHVVRIEEELRVSERLAAVGELSAKIAHEIRNPLAAISGSIQILMAGDGAAEGDRLMQIVVRETDRLNELITDFLSFARPRVPEFERVELKSLIDDLLEVFEASRPDNIRLATEAVEPIAVRADPGQLRQALWNLVLNAVQSMPEGGDLTLTVRPLDGDAPQARRRGGRNTREDEFPFAALPVLDSGSVVEISVQDTGVGMPPEVQERMFEPFFTTRSAGSGLGLSTLYRIVESHGGAVQIESEPGQGTRFAIRLCAWEEPR